MESYRVKTGNPFPKAVAYGLCSTKKRGQGQIVPTVIFERDRVKIGLTAVTFPTTNGANEMLDSLIHDNRIEPVNALIIEKNKHRQLIVTKSINQSGNAPKCSELCLAVALLLRGSVAADLLGGAANMLLAHPLELGFDREKIDSLVADLEAGNSVVFVLDSPNPSSVISTPANGGQYDFSMTDQVFTEVKIMSSTLDYYSFEG